MGSAVRTREMCLEDAEAVAELSGQLGCLSSTTQVTERFLRLHQNPNDGLFAAVQGAKVVGWIHVYGVGLLETDGYAEIGGLVVDVSARRQGSSRQLLGRAEKWTAARSYLELRLRSGLQRLDAHEFYAAMGYKPAKTSYMFRKEVGIAE